jgi:TRAP-type C4-dicarboxylate transport system permease small subunit
MELIEKMSGGFDQFNKVLAWIAGTLIVFCMAIIVVDVVMRYCFGSPQIWVYYVAEYILLFSTFLATAYVLRNNRHVKVDIVIMLMRDRPRVYLSIFSSLLGLFYCIVLGWYTGVDTYEAFLTKSKFSTALEMYQFPIKIIMPFGCLLLCLEWVRKLVFTFLYLSGKEVSPD